MQRMKAFETFDAYFEEQSSRNQAIGTVNQVRRRSLPCRRMMRIVNLFM